MEDGRYMTDADISDSTPCFRHHNFFSPSSLHISSLLIILSRLTYVAITVVSLARRLKRSGSDFLVEEGLAAIFGRGEIVTYSAGGRAGSREQSPKLYSQSRRTSCGGMEGGDRELDDLPYLGPRSSVVPNRASPTHSQFAIDSVLRGNGGASKLESN